MEDFTLSGKLWFDALPQPMLLTKNGTIIYQNPPAKALWEKAGLTCSEGDALPECLPPEEADAVTALQLGGQQWTVQTQCQPAGTLYLFSPVPTQDSIRMAQLSTLMRLRLSHLNLACEGLQNHLGEFLQRQNHQWIARQNQCLHQMMRLTEQLEFFGETEDHLELLYPRCVLNLDRVGKTVEELLLPLSQEAGHSFTYIPPVEPLFVQANDHLLRKLVYNLTANAFHAGGDVTLTLKKKGKKALMLLSDNGSGISAGDYATLFHPELREDTPYSAGFGLGLPLCQRIAALYGGQMAVTHRRKGTLVTVSIPLLRPEDCDELRSPPVSFWEDQCRQMMTEMSNELPWKCYGPDDVD